MKKILKPLFFLSVLILCICPNVYASIDNNRYDINMLCLGDAGDYCEALTLNSDEFIFGESESNFYLENTSSIGYGSYTDNGIMVEAEYTDTIPFIYKYTFEISILNVLDFMLIGTMKITYYSDYDLLESGWEDEEEAIAIFFGVVD